MPVAGHYFPRSALSNRGRKVPISAQPPRTYTDGGYERHNENSRSRCRTRTGKMRDRADIRCRCSIGYEVHQLAQEADIGATCSGRQERALKPPSYKARGFACEVLLGKR